MTKGKMSSQIENLIMKKQKDTDLQVAGLCLNFGTICCLEKS